MSKSYLLHQGAIVTPEAITSASLRLCAGKIVALGDLQPEPGDEVIDCRSLYLLPGGIETHTHLQLEAMGTVTADDFATGTRAAICGGTTTVLDFATQFHGQSMQEGLQHWFKKIEGKLYCDCGFHMALTEWNPALQAEMAAVVEQGISSFKLYMAYKDNMMVRDDAIYQALRESARLGATIGFHCENGDLIAELVRELRQAGKLAPYWHQHSRPPELEREAIQRLETIAELLAAPHYVVHLSTAAGLAEIQAARRRGSKVVAETCPQYLLLDDSLYGRSGDSDFAAAKYVISPPLRARENQDYLWEGLARGDIQFVGTDHCSFNYRGQKDRGKADFSQIPNGAPGIELRLALLYTYGVTTGRLSLQRLAAVVAENAAKYFGLYPQKGRLQLGADADVVVFNPQGESIVQASNLQEAVDYSPYEGLPLKGRIAEVFLRGELIVSQGKIVAEAKGQWLRRQLPSQQQIR